MPFGHSYFLLVASARGMNASELLSWGQMFPTPLASDTGTRPKVPQVSPISCGLLSQKEENGALVSESFRSNLLSGKGCSTQSSLQSGVGRVADGIPASMDGNLLWITEPTDIPRLTEDKKDRVKRLKALGNAVVPAQVYPILKYIADIELGRCKSACVFSGKEGGAI